MNTINEIVYETEYCRIITLRSDPGKFYAQTQFVTGLWELLFVGDEQFSTRPKYRNWKTLKAASRFADQYSQDKREYWAWRA